MNKKNLSMANEKADEEPHIHNNQHLNKDKTRWIKWGIAAVCVLLLSSAVIIAYANHRQRTNTDKSSSVPGIIVDGVTYLKSGWETDAEQCPDGFEYGGIVDQVNQNGTYLLNSKYYVSSKISEWVYVYCWVSENPAETGEENSSMAYVRFVRAVERYKTFLFYDGQLYQSLWDYCAVAKDEKTAYNNSRELEKRYGLRIEVLPESCVLAGSAHFEELDRIPQTKLQSMSIPVTKKFSILAFPGIQHQMKKMAKRYTTDTMYLSYIIRVIIRVENINGGPIAKDLALEKGLLSFGASDRYRTFKNTARHPAKPPETRRGSGDSSAQKLNGKLPRVL